MNMFKYLIMALLMYLILNYNQVNNRDSLEIVALTMIVVFVVNNMLIEGMAPHEYHGVSNDWPSLRFNAGGKVNEYPRGYPIIEEPENDPGALLGGDMPLDSLSAILEIDRHRDLAKQMPTHPWEHQPHIGKDRGYINHQKLY